MSKASPTTTVANRPHRVVLVGPTHPYPGGIAQHTTRLALELEGAGVPVVVESWKAQYPKALYKGPDRVPDNQPEVGVAGDVREDLAWYSPWSWWRVGRRSRGATVGLSIPTPFHAVPYLTLLSAAGRATKTIAIVHNVLPHEPGPLDRILMGLLLRRVDRVIVHNEQAVHTAVALGVKPGAVQVLALPSPWPLTEVAATRPTSKGPVRLLFFGTIRPYKGLDILLKALATTEAVTLTIAGEFWEDEQKYRHQVQDLGISDRVSIRAGYVAEADFPELFAGADVLVLPYRSGTGSIVRELGFRFGLPVIATSVGSIAEGVVSGENGLVVIPESVEELAEALRQAGSRETLRKWRKGVTSRRDKQAELWARYLAVFDS